MRLEHTVFALPYAYVGAILAVDGWPGIEVLGWITVAMVGARSFAMAVNRLVDAAIDARNPRTAARELPAGRLSASQVIAFALASLARLRRRRLAARRRSRAGWRRSWSSRWSSTRTSSASRRSATSGWARSTASRRSAAGSPSPGTSTLAAWLLGAAVACWIAGFDIIYATMDIEIDRAQGLHSLPADYGIARALWISRALHALSVVAMAGVGLCSASGPSTRSAWSPWPLLLAYEQQLVSPTDLSRVNMAFLSVNGVIALLYLGTVSLDVALS